MKKDLLARISKPVNVVELGKSSDETPLMFIPKDEGYIEILGYKIDGVNSFESFIEYLKTVADIEKTNEKLNEENHILTVFKENLIGYLEQKLEESKLLRVYDTDSKVSYISTQETIYNDILERIKESR